MLNSFGPPFRRIVFAALAGMLGTGLLTVSTDASPVTHESRLAHAHAGSTQLCVTFAESRACEEMPVAIDAVMLRIEHYRSQSGVTVLAAILSALSILLRGVNVSGRMQLLLRERWAANLIAAGFRLAPPASAERQPNGTQHRT